MVDPAKQIELIRELTQRTQDGSLRWEQTTQRGTYMVAFPNRAFRISGVKTPISEEYRLRIFDGFGHVQVELGADVGEVVTVPGDVTSYYIREPLKELYRAARAVAEGGAGNDAIIEDVLSEIRQLPHGGLKAG